MSKPLAVIINDIHYNINTLPLADAALRQAINKANDLNVSLIVAGDLHDTKANMRGECVNAMLKTFKLCKKVAFVLRGNHDQINEKSLDHSLNFLKSDHLEIIEEVHYLKFIDTYCIPYQHDTNEFKRCLYEIPNKAKIIMHQGLQGSNSGDYIQDKSAITKDDVAGFRVISGHYHKRQDIQLPNGGLWTYTGNPFTLNYGEANDPEKGFHVLMDDGSLEFIPTNLRKHLVIELSYGEEFNTPDIVLEDLVWVKIKGTKEQLSHISKPALRIELGIGDFKLEFIPTDQTTKTPKTKPKSQHELLDNMIDSLTNTEDSTKLRLKELWKGLI